MRLEVLLLRFLEITNTTLNLMCFSLEDKIFNTEEMAGLFS